MKIYVKANSESNMTMHEKMFNTLGFIADFQNIYDIAEYADPENIMSFDYDAFLDGLDDFVESHNLKKYRYLIGDNNYDCDIFYSDSRQKVFDFIKDNYFSDDGYQLSDEEINDNLIDD